MATQHTNDPQAITVTYTESFLMIYLEPTEVIGLNMDATHRRFQKIARNFLKDQNIPLSEDGFRIVSPNRVGGRDLPVLDLDGATGVMANGLILKLLTDHLLKTNPHWLVYDTPEDHVDALWSNPHLHVNPKVLEMVYGLRQSQAKQVIAAARKNRESV